MKKVGVSFFILVMVLVLVAFFVSIYPPLGANASTGKFLYRSVVGVVSFFVEGEGLILTIDSPENTTYNFSIGENYSIDLNVSASEEIDSWWYSLYDSRHGEYIRQNVFFNPNTSFEAVRWSNRLEVYANNSIGSKSANINLSFFVEVPNSAPIIQDLAAEHFVCEDDTLSEVFNVTDVDEDTLSFGVSPSNPFFVIPVLTGGTNLSKAELFSAILSKDDVNRSQGYELYELSVSANDGEYADTENVNVTVIEINNQPNADEIGVQTVWTQGVNSTFEYLWEAEDIEDGNYDSGNLSFNLSFLNGVQFFDINQTGFISASPNLNNTGVYDVQVCVTDAGLPNPHQNISLCGLDGLNESFCYVFELTVTDENRAPNITSYYPLDLEFNATGESPIEFNVSKYDPDFTTPDSYWYIDDIFREYDSGSFDDNFSYTVPCGFSGNRTVRVDVTDGELNDSVEWVVNISGTDCPVSSSGGGGGGGGGLLPECTEKWGCEDWGICQHTGLSFQSGILSIEDYKQVRSECGILGFDEDDCGFQIRGCEDVNLCKTNFSKPSEIQACFFLQEPSCSDNIKNCHEGSCEILVDCGGPCNACATCSDGLQNQGEQGVDCGGPCPVQCPEEFPISGELKTQYILIILTVILFVFAMYKLYKIQKIENGRKK